MGTRVKCAAFILSLVLSGAAASAAEMSGFTPSPQPEWCRPGFRCLTVADYAKMTEIKIQLQTDLNVAHIKARRFGGVVGCGPVVALSISESKVNLGSAIGCGAFLGWRF